MEDKNKILSRVIKYIYYRPRSEKEVRKYLKTQLGIKEKEKIEEIINFLKSQGFIDDRKLAEEWINIKIARGYGKERIRLELKRLGLDEEIIQEALSKIDFHQELQVAKRILEQRFTHKIKDKKEKLKVIQFLRYRGFSGEVIKALLRDGSEEY